MGKPANHDIHIYQGDTLLIYLVFEDDAGTLENLSGCVIRSQVRTKPGGDVVLDMSSAGGSPTITVGSYTVGDVTGNVRIEVPKATTAAISVGNKQVVKYVWDLEITTADGKTSTRLAGTAFFYPEVTK